MPENTTKKPVLRIKEKTRRQERAEQTKQKLMDAAVSLFGQHGYGNVSIEDITKSAGVSKGTFYCHFKSKDNVVLECLKNLDAAYHGFYREAMKHAIPVDQLLTYLRCVTDYCDQVLGLDLVKIIYASYITNEELNRPFTQESRPVYIFLEQIIRGGQKTGAFRQDMQAMEMVKLFIRVMRSCVFEWCIYNGENDLSEQSQIYFRLALEMITTRPATA